LEPISVTGSPGLYFLGLTWQCTRGSALIGWVGDDAAYIADQIKAFHLAGAHRSLRLDETASRTLGRRDHRRFGQIVEMLALGVDSARGRPIRSGREV
jgi:hypothetical protein